MMIDGMWRGILGLYLPAIWLCYYELWISTVDDPISGTNYMIGLEQNFEQYQFQLSHSYYLIFAIENSANITDYWKTAAIVI